MVEIQKLTDNLLRPLTLKNSPFTFSFTLSLSLVEVHQVEGEQDWTPPSWCSSPLTQGFPLLRRPLAPPCRVQKLLHGLVDMARIEDTSSSVREAAGDVGRPQVGLLDVVANL